MQITTFGPLLLLSIFTTHSFVFRLLARLLSHCCVRLFG